MAFTALTAAQTDANSPGDQTLMDLIRTNFDDHESRIMTVENPAVRAFSHFANRHGYASDIPLTRTTDGDSLNRDYDRDFLLGAAVNTGSGATVSVTFTEITGTTDQHYLKATLSTGTGGSPSSSTYLVAQPVLYFNNRVKPLTFEARIRGASLYSSSLLYHVGFLRFKFDGASIGTPADGIWLERSGTAGNMRFVTVNGGSPINGSDFTGPSVNTWFKVKIIFESDPSNRARCFVDGVLKETLTTELPTAKQLHGAIEMQAGVGFGTNWDFDWVEAKSAGALSEV